MATLPDGYTEIEYIEGDGGQYIDLQYKHKTNTTKYVWDMMITALPNTYASVFGARTEHDSTDAFYVGIRNTGSTYGCIGGTKKDPLGVTLLKGVKYSCQLDPAKGFVVGNKVCAMVYTTATTSSRNTYLFAGNWNGTPNEYFYGRIYSFMIYEGSTLVRHYVPCRRNSDLRLGFYELIQGSFYLESRGNKFGISSAVNAKSFANYIVSQCTMFDGTALTSANKTQLYNFLVEDFPDPSIAINLSSAHGMVNKLRILMTGSHKGIVVPTAESVHNVLSVNTARALVNIVLPESEGLRAKFVRLNQIYTSNTTFGTHNMLKWTLYLPAAASFGSPALAGTLYGGGGGGSGGQAHDGDKNSNYYTRAGAGAKGGDSVITLNGAEKARATGGAGAPGWDAGPCGANPNWSASGKAGTAGSSKSVSFNVVRKQELIILPGYGGGGGGGFGCTAATSEDYRSWAVNEMKINANQAEGGHGAERNSYGEDEAFGGGGGEGGHGAGYTYTGLGNGDFSGPANWGTRYSAGWQSNGKGGTGGYSGGDTGSGSNTAQPNTMGAAGYGGKARNRVDESSVGNGGNGGNAGGFVLTTSCAAATALFIFR